MRDSFAVALFSAWTLSFACLHAQQTSQSGQVPDALPQVRAQDKPAQPSTNPKPLTIRTIAREVDVDVVVTDDKGQPVKGLSKEDFRIYEDQTLQTALSFEAHSSSIAAVATVATPKLPANTFTNFTPPDNANPSFVILLDQLDTPIEYQTYGYQQALEFVKHLPPAVNVAIFALNARMELLQPFTSDPKLLLSALQGRRAKPQPSLLISGSAALAIDLEGNNDNYRQDILADGMTALARYLAGFPGRKNLLWITVDIPGASDVDPVTTQQEVAPLGTNATTGNNVGPRSQSGGNGGTNSLGNSGGASAGGSKAKNPLDDAVSRPFGLHVPFLTYNGSHDLAKASGALTLDHVAVYLLDARGLMTPSEQARNPNYKYQHDAMDAVSDATGGRAYYNDNGLAQVMGEIVAASSGDYRLTYSSTNKDWNGEFRHLQVKLNDYPRKPITSAVTGKAPYGSLHLAYRPGYLANGEADATSAKEAAGSRNFTLADESQPQDARSVLLHRLPKGSLQASMTLGQLPPTEIVFAANVKPVDDAFQLGNGSRLSDNDFRREKFKYLPYHHFDVLFATDAHGISLPRGEDGLRHGKVEFVTVAYSDKGDVVNSLITSVSLDLREASYQAMLKTGLGTHQSIAIPLKGEYTLRVGIRDAISDHVGALEIPLATIKNIDIATDAHTGH